MGSTPFYVQNASETKPLSGPRECETKYAKSVLYSVPATGSGSVLHVGVVASEVEMKREGSRRKPGIVLEFSSRLPVAKHQTNFPERQSQ